MKLLSEDVREYFAFSKKHGYATMLDNGFVYLVLFRMFSGIYKLYPPIFFWVRIFEKILEIVFGIYMPFTTNVAGGLIIFHSQGIVINGKAVIGKCCRLYPRVCIGSRWPGDGAPVLQNNVTIGTGACVLGPVKISEGVIVKANSVVVRNLDDCN